VNPSPRREVIGGVLCFLLATVGAGLAVSVQEWVEVAIFACMIPFAVAAIIRGLRRLKARSLNKLGAAER
jgi:hypothetical protein